MKKALIVGGANGIGLAIATCLANDDDYSIIFILDKKDIPEKYNNSKFQYYRFDLISDNFDFFDKFLHVDLLMITAGFGKLSLFKDLEERYIQDSFAVNAIAPIRIINKFYSRLSNDQPFYCGIMGSISGFMSSPFFSVYAATKAAIKIFIESVNVELRKGGSLNQILNVSPGAIKGSSFYDKETRLELLIELANQIIISLYNHSDLLIPQYDEIYKTVLERYHNDFRKEGDYSFDYKQKTQRY